MVNKGYKVSILTRLPELWDKRISIKTSSGTFETQLCGISDDPEVIVPEADIILLMVPGNANEFELMSICPYLKKGCYVGAVFCSSGLFFDVLRIT